MIQNFSENSDQASTLDELPVPIGTGFKIPPAAADQACSTCLERLQSFFLAADLVSARKPFIGPPPIFKFLFPLALLRLDLVQDQ